MCFVCAVISTEEKYSATDLKLKLLLDILFDKQNSVKCKTLHLTRAGDTGTHSKCPGGLGPFFGKKKKKHLAHGSG